MKDPRLTPLRNLLLLLLLAGCAQTSGGTNWHSWTQAMTISGKMRAERRPDDAPVTRQTLIDDFRRVAFDLERNPLGSHRSGPVPNTEPHLRKWREPISYDVVSLPGDRQIALRKIVPFMLRLVSITGHPIRQRSARPIQEEKVNLIILYGPDAAFAVFADEANQRNFDESENTVMLDFAEFIESWRFARSPCAGKVYEGSSSDGQTLPGGTIVAAIVAIKQEIPPELLEACVEEELSQAMGLLNDDPAVRPSLFNDDAEFALLTEHDEHLLKILYDDRLEPGMTPEVAMPIAHRIAGELLPDS